MTIAGLVVSGACLAGCNLADLARLPAAGQAGAVPPPLARAAEPLAGTVLGADGSPAGGVAVSAFHSLEIPPDLAGDAAATGLLGNAGAGLIGNAGSGLIGNAGSGLAGNAGSGLAGANPYRRVLSASGTTDASGSFFFRPDADGFFNFHAEQASGSKAWKLAQRVTRGATGSLTIKLAVPGRIAGTVTPAGTGSKDVLVVIPGSTYFGYAGTDGRFELPDIPAGKFELRAVRAGYQHASVSSASPLVVKAGETATVSLDLRPL